MKLFQMIHRVLILVFILFISPIAYADREQNIKSVFFWAEDNYEMFFAPSPALIQRQDPWTFTYYSATDTYVGINDNDEVWVLGDIFGGLVFIDTLSNLLASIDNGETSLKASLIQKAYIKASNTNSDDLFAYSLAISGNTLVVGAINEASANTGVNVNQNSNSLKEAGAVYVFIRDANGLWQQQAYIKPSVLNETDRFGFSVAISNNTLVVGAPGRDNTSAYVFERDGGGHWHEQQRIKAPFTLGRSFGSAVAIDGDTIAIGAFIAANIAPDVNGEIPLGNGTVQASGALFIYKRIGGGDTSVWLKQSFIRAHAADQEDFFGTSIALSGDTLVVGAPQEDSAAKSINGDQLDNSASNSGAAYVFVRDENDIWGQQAYLKASNGDMRDEFGASVAISGDTIAVGAALEDSGATGINGDQHNNDETDSGAAYVFTRDSMGSWQQQAYLKASNTDSRYKFASSIAVNNGALVVGSVFEGKSGIGINSTPESGVDRSPVSGAAYLFNRADGSWSQSAYIKASNTGIADSFGFSIALSNTILAIGAMSEFSSATGVNANQSDNAAPSSGAVYVFE